MTIPEFITKAIEGGWRPKEGRYTQLDKIAGMNVWLYDQTHTHPFCMRIEEILLDPLVWQAVGKVEGWDEGKYKSPTYKDPAMWMWHHNMHCMITALAEGETTEQYLETL